MYAGSCAIYCQTSGLQDRKPRPDLNGKGQTTIYLLVQLNSFLIDQLAN
jgi:hypothetical protein